MLNRIFIVVGILAILAISAAFIVPRFIQWGDYRGRLEALATEVLGTPVTIAGDIEFSLLPAPHLKFSDVRVGPSDAPSVSVASVDGDLSLVDFLRDRYTFTRLVLNNPEIDLVIDASGEIENPVQVSQQLAGGTVNVANAIIVDGVVRLTDERSQQDLVASDISGELKLTSVRGPFQFQGSAQFGDTPFDVRFTTSALDAEGATRLTGSLRPQDGSYSVSAEGQLIVGPAPHLSGTFTYRRSPPRVDEANLVQGDLVLESPIEAGLDRVYLGSYVLQPDENRPGNRITGAIALNLGADVSFEATASAGVLAMPARDATEQDEVEPYEFVRLLAELPEPAVPPLAGTLRADVAEINLRGLALRNVVLAASSDGTAWTIGQAIAGLAGNASVSASGTLGSEDGRPKFSGEIDVSTDRLDTLAIAWRRAADAALVPSLPASFKTGVELNGDILTLANGQLTINDVSSAVGAIVDFGPERSLALTGHFGSLSPVTSAAIAALLPNASTDAAFGVTFPNGNFDLSADTAEVAGLAGTGLIAKGVWEGRLVKFDQIAADDLGGAQFNLSAIAGGTLAEPRFAANGTVSIQTADAPALAGLYDLMHTPQSWRAMLSRSLPATLAIELSLPNEQGAQVLAASGRLGTVEVGVDAQLAGGIVKALGGPLAVTANFSANESEDIATQLGLGSVSLFPNASPTKVNATIQGAGNGSLAVGLTAESGVEMLSFDGSVNLDNLERPSGAGRFSFNLSNGSGLAETFGLAGIHVPAVQGSANASFDGQGNLSVSDLMGTSAGQAFDGSLTLAQSGAEGVISGALNVASADAGVLTAVLAGPASLIYGGDPYWPDGPIAVGDASRATHGSIAVTSPSITVAGRPVITDAAFDLVWDQTSDRIRGLTGTYGGGTIALDVGLCCAGPLAEKQLSGRLSLTDVDLSAILPPQVAESLGGTAQLTAQFEGSGESFSTLTRSLTGEGSFSVANLTVSGLNPGAFASIAAMPDLLGIEPEALAESIRQALAAGSFSAASFGGPFSIAGGTIRAANLAADSNGARLFGSSDVRVPDLGISAAFNLSPVGQTDPDGLISDSTSQVTARISGSLLSPDRLMDVSSLVDAIKLRVNEIEVDRLMKLQEEDAERQRQAAEERQRLIEENARRMAEEAARLAEEEAQQRAEEQRPLEDEMDNLDGLSDSPAPATTLPGQPLNLELPGQPSGEFNTLVPPADIGSGSVTTLN